MNNFIKKILDTLSWETSTVIVKLSDYTYFLTKLRSIIQKTYNKKTDAFYFEITSSERSKAYDEIKLIIDAIESIPESSIIIVNDLPAYLDSPGLLRKFISLNHTLENSDKKLILLDQFDLIPMHAKSFFPIFTEPFASHDDAVCIINELEEKKFSLPKPVINKFLQNITGLYANEVKLLVKKLIYQFTKKQDFDINQWVYEEKIKLFEEKRRLSFVPVPENIDRLGGLKILKQWIKKRKSVFTDRAHDYGLPVPKGIMLLGIQGCGKSLSVKILARSWEMPLLYLDFSSILNSSDKIHEQLQNTIKTAESIAPCILWIDEMDKLFGSEKNVNKESTRLVFSFFLTWLQEKTAPVFVAATANSINGIPPEFLRKGRFDELFFIDLPDVYERKEIFKIHLEKNHCDSNNFNLKQLALKTDFFTGAEIEQIIVSALYTGFFENRKIEMLDLENEIKTTNPIYMTFEDELKSLREWALKRAKFASEKRDLMSLFEK